MEIEKQKVELIIQRIQNKEDREHLTKIFQILIEAFETSEPKQDVSEKRKRNRLLKQALDVICRTGIEIGKHELISDFLDFLKGFD